MIVEMTISSKRKNPWTLLPSLKLEVLIMASPTVKLLITANSIVMTPIPKKFVTSGKLEVILSWINIWNIRANSGIEPKKKLNILSKRSLNKTLDIWPTIQGYFILNVDAIW